MTWACASRKTRCTYTTFTPPFSTFSALITSASPIATPVGTFGSRTFTETSSETLSPEVVLRRNHCVEHHAKTQSRQETRGKDGFEGDETAITPRCLELRNLRPMSLSGLLGVLVPWREPALSPTACMDTSKDQKA